jgi:AAA+ superfamily predicted ATPase
VKYSGVPVNKELLISKMLLLPTTAIEYHVSQHLVQIFPDKALIEGEMGNFNLEGYAAAKHCVLTRKTFLYNQLTTYWRGPEPEAMHPHHRMMSMGATSVNRIQSFPLEKTAKEGVEPATSDTVKKAWFDVHWQEYILDVLILTIEGEGLFKYHYWILAETEEVARNFFAAVCEWNMEIRSEVLVFDNGNWHKDEQLFQDIQNATFANLVLRGNLKQEIRDDLVQFFQSRALYEEHDIPWKRGILFVGPAGNGKTHTVKALINSLEYPCLYVKNFRAPHTHGTDEVNIRQVFDRARRSTPCILVLEDLDSLLTPQNRSFFLNELDGFAANIGIVTLATTNHPERLDPAILERPSRFDRKYPFGLPEQAEREAYIALWNEALKPTLRLSEEEIEKITAATQGFSFAYLKELFLSSKMRWIANPQQGTMGEVMNTQVGKLREQMVSVEMLVPPNSVRIEPEFGSFDT